MFSLIFAWTNSWANNRNASDLGRHRAHYDVTVMLKILNGTNISISADTVTITKNSHAFLKVTLEMNCFERISQHWFIYNQMTTACLEVFQAITNIVLSKWQFPVQPVATIRRNNISVSVKRQFPLQPVTENFVEMTTFPFKSARGDDSRPSCDSPRDVERNSRPADQTQWH